jgi:hypothetical protein
MSLLSYLAKAHKWLRAGYPAGAPRYGYVPLIALMPGPAVQAKDLSDADERPSSELPCTS